ncbi:MAG: hypothetical protein ACRD5H_09255 [Nitrososphaerales archaeon]
MAEHQYKITITPDLVARWQKEVEELQKKIDLDTANLRLLKQRLEALPLFITDQQDETPTRTPEAGREERVEIQELSPPDCIRFFLSSLQVSPEMPVSIIVLREKIQRSGYPKERFGKNFSYFYTILGRMQAAAEIVRDKDRIWLAGGAKTRLR